MTRSRVPSGDGEGEAPARRLRRALRGVVSSALLATSLAAAACASAPPEETPRQPYKVVLLPVEGGAEALAPRPAENGEGEEVPFALTPEQLEKAVFEGVRRSNAFSEIVVAPPEVGAARGEYAGDELAAAADFALRENADLILRVTVRSARIRDLGNNGASFWSSLLWFMVPAPVWTVDDRTYAVDLALEAALYEPRDVVKPTASVPSVAGRQELDLWDRGLSWWIPIVPPPFLAGNPRKVSETVTERAVEQVMDQLAKDLRTRAIPSRFEEMKVAAADGSVAVEIASRRQIRSLEVWVAGKLAQRWAETDLVPEPGSTDERRVYRRTLKVAGGAGTEVRVVAEDESGVREVRTVRLGGKP